MPGPGRRAGSDPFQEAPTSPEKTSLAHDRLLLAPSRPGRRQRQRPLLSRCKRSLPGNSEPVPCKPQGRSAPRWRRARARDYRIARTRDAAHSLMRHTRSRLPHRGEESQQASRWRASRPRECRLVGPQLTMTSADGVSDADMASIACRRCSPSAWLPRPCPSPIHHNHRPRDSRHAAPISEQTHRTDGRSTRARCSCPSRADVTSTARHTAAGPPCTGPPLASRRAGHANKCRRGSRSPATQLARLPEQLCRGVCHA